MNPQMQHMPNPPARPSQDAGTPQMAAPTAPPLQPLALQPAQDDSVNNQAASEPTQLSEVEMDRAWIDRARSLIEHTMGDPFTQSREIAKLRAEYLKARFEKHIKVSEEHKK